MKSLDALNTDKIALRAKLWEEDKSAVGLHDLSDLVEASQKYAIDLGRRDHAVLHEQSRGSCQLVNLLLRHSNVLWCVASNEDLLWVPSGCTRMAVSVDLREWWREIDGCVRCRLNELDILSGATADYGV